MTYKEFIESVKQLLKEKQVDKFVVPTLGGRSLFVSFVEDKKLKIINKEGSDYIFEDSEYLAIRERFSDSSDFLRFKTCNYTRTSGNACCVGWTTDNGNKNEVYWGYLPAVFKELYVLSNGKICVCESIKYQNSDILNYNLTDWNLFAKKEKDILKNLEYSSFIKNLSQKESKDVTEKSFYEAKAIMQKFYSAYSPLNFIFVLWEDIKPVVTDILLSIIIEYIIRELKEQIIERWKSFYKNNHSYKFPRRNCKKCPKNK